ncbi:hypothetical protein QFC21_006864 [Naganishia friedmannii]|uniref:Uncharacterized protein n=1 Tax=Naganishia friedmannii TaxID=89922 RepID=A0ACC2UZ54_9TREE|nr:hypothetical protein QFC21_006864 [Naganishia friedmannii]
MASPNPPPFSETFQKSIPRSPTLVGERDSRRSSFFAKRTSTTSDYFSKPAQGMTGITRPDRALASDSDHTPPNYDLDAPLHAGKTLASPSTLVDAASEHSGSGDNGVEDTFARLSSVRKHVLLAIFSLATALDVVSVSGLITTTESISVDLGLQAGNITWILTAYSMTFASFLLFWGRVSDLYPAHIVFEGGFVMLAVFFLISSFVTNKYGFLVLRALQGIAASSTIPSAYHLIVHLFPVRDKQQSALALLGLIAAIANTLGVVLGGVFELASWRWLFRFMAILAFASAGIGALIMPWKMERHVAANKFSKLQRLDLVGVFLMTAALLLFILGLTSGTTDGWKNEHFLAPFLISCLLTVAFFVWESRIHEDKALLSMKLLKLPNLILLCFMAMTPYLWWGTVSLALANYYQIVSHHSAILAAARILPIGIAGLVGGTLVQYVPTMLSRPKWTVIVGVFMAIVPATVLLILADGGHGNDYWKYMAGLYTLVDNDLSNWKGTQYGFYFVIAWLAVSLLAFAIFYRPEASQKVLQELDATEKVPVDGVVKSTVSPV